MTLHSTSHPISCMSVCFACLSRGRVALQSSDKAVVCVCVCVCVRFVSLKGEGITEGQAADTSSKIQPRSLNSTGS